MRLSPLLARRVAVSQSLIGFAKTVMPEMFEAETPIFHYELEKRLMNLGCRQTNIVAPRGHAKSSIACISAVLWHMFGELYYRVSKGLPIRGRPDSPQHSYTLIVSKTFSDAKQRMRHIKTVLGDTDIGQYSPQFREVFGDWGQKTARLWQQDQIILKDGSTIRSIGTGQNVHGLNEDNVRPTLVIVDDPENTENTKNQDAMRANMKWLYESIIPGLYPKFGRLVVIGTPLNTSCMVVRLHQTWLKDGIETDSIWFMQSLSKNEHYYSLRPGDKSEDHETIIDKWGTWEVRPGLLWEKWIDRKTMERRKQECADNESLSVGVFHRQYECQIRGDSEEIFKDEWFDNTWDGRLIFDNRGEAYLEIFREGDKEYDEPKHVHVGVSSGYDPAYSVSHTSSYTAAANIATTADDIRYELPWIYDKFDPNRTIAMYKHNQDSVRHRRAMCEANGPQLAFFEALQKAGMTIWKDSNVHKSKIERVAMLQWPIANNQFYFMESTPARSDAQDYPRGSMDYLDALEKADRCRIKGSRYAEYDKDSKVTSKKYISSMVA